MFQLCTRDEYRQVNILESGQNWQDMLAKAQGLVNDENMENAFTLAEKKRTFTAVIPQILSNGVVDPNLVYAGTNGRGEHLVAVMDQSEEGEVEESLLKDVLDDTEFSIRFYVGTDVTDRKNNVKIEMFAENSRGEIVTDIADQILEGKTFYYIKPI